MLQSLYVWIQAIQPLLVPLCFLCAWALILLVSWSIGSSVVASLKRAKQMHRIPCANCAFFTGDYRLKCTVNPKIALSEEAIGCPDYRSPPRLY
ncbi:MAG: hypothetical protein ACM37W_26545 [Actinomycetota bacterium]